MNLFGIYGLLFIRNLTRLLKTDFTTASGTQNNTFQHKSLAVPWEYFWSPEMAVSWPLEVHKVQKLILSTIFWVIPTYLLDFV